MKRLLMLSLLILISVPVHATDPEFLSAGIVLWPLLGNDSNFHRPFGHGFLFEDQVSKFPHRRFQFDGGLRHVRDGEEFATYEGLQISGVDLWEKRDPACIVYGPYRKHSQSFDLDVEIQLRYEENSVCKRSFEVGGVYRDALEREILRIDIYQKGSPIYDSQIITLGEISTSHWTSFSLFARNIDPDPTVGYEVRICPYHDNQPVKFSCGKNDYINPITDYALIQNLKIGKYYIREVSQERE